MMTEDNESASLLDDMPDDIRRELLRRVAEADRDANRDVYNALEDESHFCGCGFRSRLF